MKKYADRVPTTIFLNVEREAIRPKRRRVRLELLIHKDRLIRSADHIYYLAFSIGMTK